MNNNKKVFESISTRDGHNLLIDFTFDNFQKSLDEFRMLTSKIYSYESIDYQAVYLPHSDYAGLTILDADSNTLGLIVNLEFFYVHGFLLSDNKVYAFKEEAESLENLGFVTTPIPYGDSYGDIKKQLGDKKFNELLNTNVQLPLIMAGLKELCNCDIDFKHKAQSILVVLWSFIEGIRFSAISDVVAGLLQYHEPKNNHSIKFSYFYNLAEIWADLSVDAAENKKPNQNIAVYDLHRLNIPPLIK